MHCLLLIQTENTWCLLLAINCRSRDGAADRRMHIGNRITTLLHVWQAPNSQNRVENIKTGLFFPCSYATVSSAHCKLQCSHLQFLSSILQFVVIVYKLVEWLSLNTDVIEDINNEIISGAFGCRLITSLTILHIVRELRKLGFLFFKTSKQLLRFIFFFY